MIESRLPQRIEALALALRLAAAARRRPCLVRSTELVQLSEPFGELNIDSVGIIGRSTFHMRDLYRALGGRVGWGSAPTYTRGIWAL